MKISLDHDRLFEPSKSTFFFSYENFQIKETCRKYKMATWQYQTKSLQPLSCWTQVITRDLCLQLIFNDCRRTNFFWIGSTGRLREWSITKPGTVIFLFRSGNINLSGVTLSFKELKRRKISLLYMWLNVFLVVSINTAVIASEPNITSCTYFNKYFFEGGL